MSWFSLRFAAALSTIGILAACAAAKTNDELPGGETDELATERQLRGIDLQGPTLSLTFDDGPGERTTELAEFLASEGISATFFINGAKAPGRQHHIDAVVRNGHLLANHTQNHLQLSTLSASRIVDEIAQTDSIISSVQPDRPFLLRAPFGDWNGNVAAAINGTAMRKYVGSIFWDVGGRLTSTTAADWECWNEEHNLSVHDCTEAYLTEIRARGHGVVLMHDIHNKTVDMVKEIVPRLKAEGFGFTSLLEVPSIRRAINGSCGVESDSLLHCVNSPNTPMHRDPTAGSPVVNTLRTTDSFFICWATGELHAGGNTTWYRTTGDDNANLGFVPASALQTHSDFDANPSAKGLPRCSE